MPSSSFPKRLHQLAVPLIGQPRAQSSRPVSGFLGAEFSFHLTLSQWFWFPATEPCLRHHAKITCLLCGKHFCGHQIQFKLWHYMLLLSPFYSPTSHSLSCLWHQEWLSLPFSFHFLFSQSVLVFSYIHPGLRMGVSPMGCSNLWRGHTWCPHPPEVLRSSSFCFFPHWAPLSLPVPSFLYLRPPLRMVLLETARGTLAPVAPIFALAWVVFWNVFPSTSPPLNSAFDFIRTESSSLVIVSYMCIFCSI